MNAPITDLDAERAVLSACLTDRSYVSKALKRVVPEDFYDPLHREVFGIMAELDGSEWDSVSVAREVRRCSGEVAASKAIRLMVELGGEPVSGDVLGHSGAVADAASNRKLVDLLRQALAAAELRRPDEALEIIHDAERLERAQVEVQSIQALMLHAYTIAQEPRAKSVLTWGHYQLDEMTGGLMPGDVAVVGGGTSQGKSSQALAMAQENIRRGARALIVSLEDGPETYGKRFLSRASGVNAKSIRDHRINPADHSRLTAAIEGTSNSPAFLHCEDMPWERVSILIDQTVLREQIDLVILDYIQECWCERQYPSRYLELQAIARRFRAIMRKRKRAGIILTQLTGAEDGKPPRKEMARECQDIVNGAEQVVLLFTNSDGEKLCNVDKSKNGNKGVVQLKWDNETASYQTVGKLDESMQWIEERFGEGTMADVDGAIGSFP